MNKKLSKITFLTLINEIRCKSFCCDIVWDF